MKDLKKIAGYVVNLDLMGHPLNWVTIITMLTLGTVAYDLSRRAINQIGDE